MRLIQSGHFFTIILPLLALMCCNNQTTKQLNATKSDETLDSLSLKIEQANQQLDAGNAKKAIRLLETEIDKNPSNTRLLNNLGMAYLSDFDTSRAIAIFQESLGIDSSQPGATYQLGFLFAAVKNDKALNVVNVLIKQKGINKEELNAQGHYIKGLYFVNIGRAVDALKEFDESIISNYTFLDPYIEKAIVLYEINKFDESLKILSKVVAIDRYQSDAYFWMAKNHEKLGNTEDAKYFYQQTLDLAPDFESAKTGLSSLNKKQK
jgi:tetratricopeptide (TPR) repeat protein